ncbi:autotransporter outer membrane beta-barrel domain-containing protein [Leminorella grimontii]|uniref:autotransporter outer membrane beta-barrel domain-containing protein n=1 Tax=Leminorella grimontii TaxID=82981 RepID=UPI00321F644B
MNRIRRGKDGLPTVPLALLMAFGLGISSLQAATQYWDGAGAENDGIVAGGSGVWSSGSTNWTTADGLTNAVWGLDEAVFSSGAGVVVISDKLLTQRLRFIFDGYVLNAQSGDSGLTFLGDFTIDSADGVTATINASLEQQSFGVENNLFKTGGGTLVLNGDASFGGRLAIDGTMIVAGNIGHYGGTTVNDGAVLQIGNGGSSGMVDFDIVNNGALVFNRSDNFSFTGRIEGVGDTVKRGSGTLYLLNNSVAQGTTTIEQGTLSVGDGVNDGTILGDIINNGRLIYNRSNYNYSGHITGSGDLTKMGASELVLSGVNDYAGITTVAGGILRIEGVTSTPLVQVLSGAALTGDSVLNGSVNIGEGATFILGDSGGALTVNGDFSLLPDAKLRVLLGTPDPSGALLNVNGALTLGGVLNVDALSGFTPGVYRLINYSGALSDSGLLVGDVPVGYQIALQTGIVNQVNVLVSPGELAFWDGGQSSPNGAIDGGDGVWDAVQTNWAVDGGGGNYAWAGKTAIFSASAGTVTLANDVHVQGMQFITDGYRIVGNGHALIADAPTLSVQVDDGARADVDAAIGGSGGVRKTGSGILGLSGNNDYQGGTRVDGGVLLASSDASLGLQSAGVALDNGGTLQFQQSGVQSARHVQIGMGGGGLKATDATFSGNVDSVGGELRLAGGLTFTGAINALQVAIEPGARVTLKEGGRLNGNVANDGLLRFQHAGDLPFLYTIQGAGMLEQDGDGALTFNHDQPYLGETRVSRGSLLLTDNARLSATSRVDVAPGALLGGYGAVAGDVNNAGTLAVADAVTSFSQMPAGVFTIGGNLSNQGALLMASPVPASVLHVRGNYAGGGTLTLSTALGGDDSATDKLVIDGDSSGNTGVVVHNAGGSGAQTQKGIEVISVGGESRGTFSLQNRVVAGPYEYQLRQNATDGGWYLQSASSPIASAPLLRPEPGAYLANLSVAEQLFMRTWRDRQEGSLHQNGFWLRTRGSDTQYSPNEFTLSSQTFMLESGLDAWRWQQGKHQVVSGVMAGYGRGHSKSSVQGNAHSAYGTVSGYNAGAYATYRYDERFYVDSWWQYAWFDNDVSGAQLAQENYDSRIFSASLEAGYRLSLPSAKGNDAYIEPQLQVIYSDYSQDALRESGGKATVDAKGGGWQSRTGVRLAKTFSNGGLDALGPFIEMNWRHRQSGDSLSFDRVSLEQGTPRDRYGATLGAQAQLGPRWKLLGQVETLFGKDDYASVAGVLSVGYRW